MQRHNEKLYSIVKCCDFLVFWQLTQRRPIGFIELNVHETIDHDHFVSRTYCVQSFNITSSSDKAKISGDGTYDGTVEAWYWYFQAEYLGWFIQHDWIYREQKEVESKQGKSEGFDSCDRPSNLTRIGFKSSIFQPVWPWNLMGDLERF